MLGFMLVIFLFIVGLLERHRAVDRRRLRHPLDAGAGGYARLSVLRGGEAMERATVDKAAQPTGVQANDGRRGLRAHRARRTRTASRCARAAASARSPGASTSSRSTASRSDCAGSAWSAATWSPLMLTNRPEFHLADTAAMSLGATPFSLYQTLAPEQIAYQVNDSGAEVIVTEPAFLENVKAALAGRAEREARRAGRRRRLRGGHDPVRRPARDARATPRRSGARARRSSRATCSP